MKLEIILASFIGFSWRQLSLYCHVRKLFPLQIILVMDPPAQNTADVKKCKEDIN